MQSEESNFDLPSDGENEDEEHTLDSYQSTSSWTLEDIDKLKDQTNALLDPAWKHSRNQQLIHKLLELEQPSITAKMVEFLLQDPVCEALVGFITQNDHSGERPGPNDIHGEGMRLAYRAVILLSPEVISDQLNLILSKKAGVIARKLFDIFLGSSGGSFYHAYRVLECLLRCYPSETFDGLTEDGNLSIRMTNMMKYVGYPPVCELVVMLIAFTPVVRNSPLCISSAKSRWIFLDHVNTWNIMANTVRAMVHPVEHCACSLAVPADQHSTAASQLFQDLIEKLSLEDSGDLLFLPIGQNSDILDLLLNTLSDGSADSGVRRSAAKNVGFLLRRAAEPEIVCFVATNPAAPPTPNYIPNRLHTLREKIVTYVRNRIESIMSTVLSYEPREFDDAEPLKFSSYEVPQPFGVLRQMIIEVIVLTVESDESVASSIPLELWRSLISWVIKYAHNSIYHALFYRLIFAVLRQGKEAPQRMLFQKAKFATFLVDNFVPYSENGNNCTCISEPLSKRDANYDNTIRKVVARGLIMNCANAIRFQTSTEAANSFLLIFMANHARWNEFLPLLNAATDAQMKFGMGIRIVILEAKPGGQTSLAQLISEAKPSEDNMDHHVRFAKSLGFFEDAPWSFESSLTPDGDKEVEETTRFSYLAHEEDSMNSSPPQTPAEE